MLGLRLLSVAIWTFVFVVCLVLYPIAVLVRVLTAPFDPQLRVLHQLTCFWASLYTWFNPGWIVKIEGREKIRPEAAYVMVANHQSLLDIIVLFRLFNHYKWVSKIENFKIPFIGWNMSLNRYIKLKRGDRQSTRLMLEECRRNLQAGSSIMMFPEGTRSPNGRLRSFKAGAFQMAIDTGCPILPITIEGSADALPKRGLILQGRHHIRIRVHDEIPYETFAAASAESLTERVHDLIADLLDERYKPARRAAVPTSSETSTAGGDARDPVPPNPENPSSP